MESEHSEAPEEPEVLEDLLEVEEAEDALPFAVVKQHWNHYFSSVPPQSLNVLRC